MLVKLILNLTWINLDINLIYFLEILLNYYKQKIIFFYLFKSNSNFKIKVFEDFHFINQCSFFSFPTKASINKIH